MKKFILFILILLLLFTGFKFVRLKLNDDFMISNIYGQLQHEESWKQEPPQNLEGILNKNFYYLGKGCQSYVFGSQDGKYVIKFLKHQHLRNDWWWEILPLPSSLSLKLAEKRKQKQEIFNSIAHASLIAANELKQETGVIYAHMYLSSGFPTIQIIDRLNNVYLVDLNQVEFIVQKRVLPALTLLQELAKKNDHKGFQETMQKILKLLAHRFEKGYYDNDRSTLQNVGFTEDGRAVIVDIGKLDKGAKGDYKPMLRRRLVQIRKQIRAEFPIFEQDILNVIEKLAF